MYRAFAEEFGDIEKDALSMQEGVAAAKGFFKGIKNTVVPDMKNLGSSIKTNVREAVSTPKLYATSLLPKIQQAGNNFASSAVAGAIQGDNPLSSFVQDKTIGYAAKVLGGAQREAIKAKNLVTNPLYRDPYELQQKRQAYRARRGLV